MSGRMEEPQVEREGVGCRALGPWLRVVPPQQAGGWGGAQWVVAPPGFLLWQLKPDSVPAVCKAAWAAREEVPEACGAGTGRPPRSASRPSALTLWFETAWPASSSGRHNLDRVRVHPLRPQVSGAAPERRRVPLPLPEGGAAGMAPTCPRMGRGCGDRFDAGVGGL